MVGTDNLKYDIEALSTERDALEISRRTQR